MALVRANLEEEFAKNPQLNRDDFDRFKDWANKQPHLPEIDDVTLVVFLKRCRYSNEIAKQRLDNFFTIRTICPDVFRNMDPRNEVFRRHTEASFSMMLPKSTPEGYRVFLMKFTGADVENFVYLMHTKCIDMACTLDLAQKGSSEGALIVIDHGGYTFEHTIRTDFALMKKYFHYVQSALPYRIKGVHVINASNRTLIERIVAMVRPFVKPKVMNLLNIHNRMEDILDYIPKDCLPSEYGGTLGPFAELRDQQIRNLEDNADFFVGLEKLVTDESKRPGKPKFEGGFYGIDGTFKKLNID